MKCSKRRKGGGQCRANAVAGTDACAMHSGRSLAEQRARGAVVLELAQWGLSDVVRDPGQTLLQLMTQSAMRAEFYAGLLQQAYEAAERLKAAGDHGHLPDHADNPTDEDRALRDLDRVFTTGGVSALIGIKWGAAGKDGHLFQVEEGLRGLVRLEAEERDRCAGMAAKAIAAGLAERQVRLAEQAGAAVAQAMREILATLGHDPGDPHVMQVVATRLHALAAGAG